MSSEASAFPNAWGSLQHLLSSMRKIAILDEVTSSGCPTSARFVMKIDI
jgi:hypothetical protein